MFQRRLQYPEIGDHVEVAWRGKFRLDVNDIYQGLAWWISKVVEVEHANNKYKIHYPGWDSRWDEWVVRSRLRWTVEHDKTTVLKVGDRVELWCCGQSVPGAWLDTTIRKVKRNQYGVLRSQLSSSVIWVPRDRIRPMRRRRQQASDTSSNTEQVEGGLFGNCLPLTVPTLTLGSESYRCCIM